jgi:hypothetical protein
MAAFRKGPPGVLRKVEQVDSAPPDYAPLGTSYNDERSAIADAIRAYLDCMGVRDPLASPLDKDYLRRRLSDLDRTELGVVLALTMVRIDELGFSTLSEMLRYLAANVENLEARR